MRAGRVRFFSVLLAAFLFPAPFPVQASAGVKSTFLYSLANFHGNLPYNEVRVRVDRARDEVYVVERGIVRVFNESGMEFFWFGDNPELESIYDLAVDEKGDVSLLSFNFTHPEDPKYFLVRLQLPGRREGEADGNGSAPRIFPVLPQLHVLPGRQVSSF